MIHHVNYAFYRFHICSLMCCSNSIYPILYKFQPEPKYGFSLILCSMESFNDIFLNVKNIAQSSKK